MFDNDWTSTLTSLAPKLAALLKAMINHEANLEGRVKALESAPVAPMDKRPANGTVGARNAVGRMPYADDPGQTHYEDCYRETGHHNCAVRRCDALLASNTTALTVLGHDGATATEIIEAYVRWHWRK